MSDEITILTATLEAHKRGLKGASLATVLIILSEPATLGIIARRIGVSNASITGTADQLEKQGYVTRGPCKHDRRKIALTLTNKGIAAVESIINES
jgi:DNA-binding MarR family transcriptional regulator